MITRRTLLRGTVGTLAGATIARSASGTPVKRFHELPIAGDERLKTLITSAVDAAMAAGAKYADARLTFTQDMVISGGAYDKAKNGAIPNRQERMDFGVRAQFDGYWGFASSPVWTTDVAARLGRSAVAEAKANVLGKPRDIEMAPNPGATSGDWSMPVTDDPFVMPPEEIYDYLSGLQLYMFNLPQNHVKNLGAVASVAAKGDFSRQQKAFGSSEGQFVTQRLYRTGGSIGFRVFDPPSEGGASAGGSIAKISSAGAGFEYLRQPQIREWARQLYEELAEERKLPVVPVDVGRYLTLIHPDGVANILVSSVGTATEIDRVMGYEANATGTSYIVDPDEAVGTLKIGAPIMQVTGTRSLPGGLAWARWDDEGVEPNDFPLVTNGILTTLQTNREGAAWMKRSSNATGQPLRSHGCAHSPYADDPPLVHPADLRLHPDSARDTTLDQLREQMDKGIELKGGGVSMDFQQSTGLMRAAGYEIRRGKRVARIAGSGMLFRTSELWGNLQTLGGTGSVIQVATAHYKGEPPQVVHSTVATPPAVFKDMSIINPLQKA